MDGKLYSLEASLIILITTIDSVCDCLHVCECTIHELSHIQKLMYKYMRRTRMCTSTVCIEVVSTILHKIFYDLVTFSVNKNSKLIKMAHTD